MMGHLSIRTFCGKRVNDMKRRQGVLCGVNADVSMYGKVQKNTACLYSTLVTLWTMYSSSLLLIYIF